MNPRLLYMNLWQELASSKNMIFMAGPRQAGKTTLAQMIARSFSNQLYFNYDIIQDRRRLLENPLFFQEMERKDASIPLIILDEIHKYRDWKNYLKGICDQFHTGYQFMVLGSGRLDIYQRGGDSLAGRYVQFHLWPLTLAELGNNNTSFKDFLANPLSVTMENYDKLNETWMILSKLSGFPEPFFSGKEMAYRRWSNIYSQQLIREDIRDLTGLKLIGDMETLYHLLPTKVGSPISIPSLSRDLKVSYNTIRNWLSIFERFFLVFSITPWTQKISRAILKEQKVYVWDFPKIDTPGALFENMVAIELYRAVTMWNHMGYGRFSLHFIRNKEHEEVDFLIAERHNPILLVETRLSDTQPSSALKRFQKALNIPSIQLMNEGEGFRLIPNSDQMILISPACQWLSRLP